MSANQNRILANTKARSIVTILRDGIIRRDTRLTRIIRFRCIQRGIEVLWNLDAFLIKMYGINIIFLC